MVALHKRQMLASVCGVFVLALMAGTSVAATLYVDDNAPGDPAPGDPTSSDPLENGSQEHPYDAIQEAINAATGGDVVLVLPGVYTGTGNRDLDPSSKPLTILARDGAAGTIIDCQSLGRGFVITGSAKPVVIDGFTIRYGKTTQSGGGIYCVPGSAWNGLTVYRCVMEYCEAQSGGGIFCQGNAPVFRECVMRHCSPNGACIYAYPAWSSQTTSPTFEHCTFTENTGAGILYYADDDAFICYTKGFTGGSVSRCVVVANGTNGIDMRADYTPSCSMGIVYPDIINTLVAGNGGHGFNLYGNGFVEPRIVNTTIAHNSGTGIVINATSGYIYNVRLLNSIVAFNATGISRSTTSASIVRYNNVWGNVTSNYGGNLSDQTGLNGNISADPLFWDSSNRDGNPDNNYVLNIDSSCIDAGNNADVLTGTLLDLAGNPRFFDDLTTPDTGSGAAPIVDMGAYEYHGLPCNTPRMDTNGDQHVDATDFDAFSGCYNGPTNKVSGDCLCMDANSDQYVDAVDFDTFSACYNGPTNPPRCGD